MIISSRAKGAFNVAYRALRLYHSNRSLPAWQRFLAHFGRRMAGRQAPMFTTFGLTNRCQCRCQHCYINAYRKDERGVLNTEECRSVLDELARLGVLEVIFSGGNPLLRPDLLELIRHAHGAGLLTRLNTHGWGLTRGKAARLKEAGLSQCAISVDDVEAQAHDRTRGLPGLHAKALNALANLRESGIPCQISALATKRLIAHGGLEAIISLGRRLGVLSVYFCLPVAAGSWEGAQAELLDEEELAKVWSLLDATFVHCDLSGPGSPCRAGTRKMLYVSPSGDVTLCPFIPYAMGNVREHRIRDIWERHCDAPGFMCRGFCPMNQAGCREMLRRRAEIVSAGHVHKP